MNCPKAIAGLERNFGIQISPIACQKRAGHSGMDFSEQLLDLGVIRGRLAVGWDGHDVWVDARDLEVISEGSVYEPELIFKELQK